MTGPIHTLRAVFKKPPLTGRWEILTTPAPLSLLTEQNSPAPRVLSALLGRKVPRENLGHRVKRERRVNKESLGQSALSDPRVHKVIEEIEANGVSLAFREIEVSLAQWGREASKAMLGLKETVERMGFRVPRESQAQPDLKVRRANGEIKGFRAYKAPKVPLAQLDRRERKANLAKLASGVMTASRHTRSQSNMALRERKRSG